MFLNKLSLQHKRMLFLELKLGPNNINKDHHSAEVQEN